MSPWWHDIERWLIGERISPGAGSLDTSIQSTWAIAPGIAWLTLLVGASMVLFVYGRESPAASRLSKGILAGIRIALAGIVLFMLFGWTIQRHRTDLPDVVVVLDDSTSMGIVDAYD